MLITRTYFYGGSDAHQVCQLEGLVMQNELNRDGGGTYRLFANRAAARFMASSAADKDTCAVLGVRAFKLGGRRQFKILTNCTLATNSATGKQELVFSTNGAVTSSISTGALTGPLNTAIGVPVGAKVPIDYFVSWEFGTAVPTGACICFSIEILPDSCTVY